MNYDFVIIGYGILGKYALSRLPKSAKICLIDIGASINILTDIKVKSNIDYQSHKVRNSFYSSSGKIWGGATMNWPTVHRVTKSMPNLPTSLSELKENEDEIRHILSIKDFQKRLNAIGSGSIKEKDFEVINALVTPDVYLNSINKEHSSLTKLSNHIGLRIIKGKTQHRIIIMDAQSSNLKMIQTEKIILAAGTIENTRILLNSKDRLGLHPNKYLATNLADHLCIDLGQFEVTSDVFDQRSSLSFSKRKYSEWPRFRFSTGTRKIESFVHVVKVFNPDLPSTSDKILSKFNMKRSTSLNGKIVTLQLFAEKVNDFDCRIYPNEKPHDGLLNINVDFWIQNSEMNYLCDLATEYTNSLIENGIARNIKTLLGTLDLRSIYTALHPSGTLRMAHSRKLGVVDMKSLLFDNSNIMILGTSVFPRAMAIHPTLTSMALARIALAKL
jgi:hypothetical protein